jgi:hypothetical protein
MNPYAEHAAGLAELQTEQGSDCPTFDWYKTGVKNGKTATIKILPGSLMLKSANSVGGLSLESDFSCTCLASDFTDTPNTNQTIIYRGKKLSISAVYVQPTGAQLQIKANDAANSL